MLTSEGATKVRKVLSIAKYTLDVEIDRILSSPYKRASESAEIAKEILKPKKPKIILTEALAPGNLRTKYILSFQSRNSDQQTEF